MIQITCFIASAFGFDEVDKIYDKAIVPVLRELNIKPLRIDRINHNNKIDSKIIELIQKCDFGIADLTFARPSVYYEAGFIEGLNKSVIYLTRTDHFKQKESDFLGNERIHFDLITKNIIPWTDANTTFRKKIKSRINLILKSINTKKKQNIIEIESARVFQTLSLKERIELAQRPILNLIKKKRLKPISFRYIRNAFGNKNLRISFESMESLTQNDLILYSHQASELSNHYSMKAYKIFLVLNSIPKRRIEAALSYFKPIDDKVYEYKKVKYIFLDKIDSEYRINQMIQNLNLE